MSVYRLPDIPAFPPVSHAEPDGLLAVGGDLSPERLVNAYSAGIFPWFEDDDQLLWWAPDPRLVLIPDEFKVSRNLGRTLRSGKFRITADTAFEQVIRACRDIRREGQNGTWITEGMLDAYTELHHLGLAHSVETWQDDTLVGGLYGVSLGSAFFGESMFSRVTDASKVAFAHLARTLHERAFALIDCQLPTPHLESLGAKPVSREDFMCRLDDTQTQETQVEHWCEWFNNTWPTTKA